MDNKYGDILRKLNEKCSEITDLMIQNQRLVGEKSQLQSSLEEALRGAGRRNESGIKAAASDLREKAQEQERSKQRAAAEIE